jgi:hypothetical protein
MRYLLEDDLLALPSCLAALSCGIEADGANEGIEMVDNALIEAIKLRSPLGIEAVLL